MNEATRNTVADELETLASQESWNSAVWQRCFNLVTADWGDEPIEFVRNELIHYDDVFHPGRILGLQVKPEFYRIDDYRREFRAVAVSLRAYMSLMEAKKLFGLSG